MADKNQESIDASKVEAVSLDDWEVSPVGLDDWVVDDAEPAVAVETKAPPEEKEEIQIDSSAETIPLPQEPVAPAAESISLDDWIVDAEDDEEEIAIEPSTEATTVEEADLEGPIEISEDSFDDSKEDLTPVDLQTQEVNINLQGDLSELEEAQFETKAEETLDLPPNEDSDEDLLADIESQSDLQLQGEADFDAEEPVHVIQDDDLADSTEERIDLELDESSVLEADEVEEPESIEDSPFDADEPIPTVEANEKANEIEEVELDLDGESDVEPEPEESQDVELDLSTDETSEEVAASLDEDNTEPETPEVELDLEPESEEKVEEPEAAEVELDLGEEEPETDDGLDLELQNLNPQAPDLEVDLGEKTEPEPAAAEPEPSPEPEVLAPINTDFVPNMPAPALAAATILAKEIVVEAPVAAQPEPAVALEEDDLASEHVDPNTLPLQAGDLAENHWIKLGEADLAENHQLGVLRLTEADLRENSDLAVIRLHEADFADNHRKVIELDPNFFENHDIERDTQGVILLKADDLVDPSVLEEEEEVAEKPSRQRSKSKRAKESKGPKFSDKDIVKWSTIISVVCAILLVIIHHFKYPWVTVSEKEYAEIKESSDSVDWIMKKVFMYRTPDSSMRWYGVQKLNSRAYKKAEEAGEMMWLFYYDSGSNRDGDNYP